MSEAVKKEKIDPMMVVEVVQDEGNSSKKVLI